MSDNDSAVDTAPAVQAAIPANAQLPSEHRSFAELLGRLLAERWAQRFQKAELPK